MQNTNDRLLHSLTSCNTDLSFSPSDKFMRIGVFGNRDSWYVNELCRHGHQRQHEMHALLFQDFTANVSGKGIRLQCGDVDLRTLDCLLIRTMPPGSLEQVVSRMDLLSGLQTAGVNVINPPRALECAVDKYLTTQRLAFAGLPVPATMVCENAEAAFLGFEKIGGDVVVKPLFGAEGRGIIRVSDPELAMRAFRTLERLGAVLYLQEFIRGPGFDIRVLLLNGEIIGSMKRVPRAGDFRANISQQGTGLLHEPTEQELALARSAAAATDCVFAGVDLMYDADHNPLIIEVNAVPGWRGLQKVCGTDVPGRLFDWIEGGVRMDCSAH
jgi:ribosomal protein S6--L-glutamate ligase